MAAARRLTRPVVAALETAKIIGLRAGLEPHRFLGVWVVVVDGRAFVRPWYNAAHGWYRAFLDEPRGFLQVGERQLPIRMVRCRGERLLDAIDAAYAEKYPTPASRKWVRGFRTPRRRATTLEIGPR
jgi:hypothetical protein